MPVPTDKRPHILLVPPPPAREYKTPRGGGGGGGPPPHDRQAHALKLLAQLSAAQVAAIQRKQQLEAEGIEVRPGLYLEVVGEPGQELALKQLEPKSVGVELVATFREQVAEPPTEATSWVEHATLYIPEQGLQHFEMRVNEYRTQNTKPGATKPKNQALVDSIGSVRPGDLRSLWTDEPNKLPQPGVLVWWEVWLRSDEPSDELAFREGMMKLGLPVSKRVLRFPDRTVLLVQATAERMVVAVDALKLVAELRHPRGVASEYLDLAPHEKADWARDLATRTTPAPPSAPSVCVLDTGVNAEHQLLAPSLHPSDRHAVNAAWGTSDHDPEGHGTQMAGLALYGDLTEALGSQGPVSLLHRLESVKILPPAGSNPPELFGAVTSAAVALAEIGAPGRARAFSLSVTAPDNRAFGQPSSWSAELDTLAAGVRDEQRRLLFVAAGNTSLKERKNYPDSNVTDQVHDPGQAWNAVTVGAYTQKVSITEADYAGWTPLADAGDLSPCSATGVDWDKEWPNKPDIVLEGGNMARSPEGEVESLNCLSLLTTGAMGGYSASNLFKATGDTSAATALAARMAAQLQAHYPHFWPETLRGLLAHSADWTPALRSHFGNLERASERDALLRWCGYGVPDLERALWSAGNALTLVAQDALQPFDKQGGETKPREYKLYALPWPAEALSALGDVEVELRVTLSYFVEPAPGQLGWRGRHEYASHGLRFEMKNPVESDEAFRRRISASEREDQKTKGGYGRPTDGWVLGPRARERGSLHSDRWRGSAVELARCNHLAVFPVGGWWKERARGEPWRKKARYSLLVSISTPETIVDLYTAVLTKLQVPITIS